MSEKPKWADEFVKRISPKNHKNYINTKSDSLSEAAEEMGKAGGEVTGGVKAEHSRENGKKGGRPPT